MATVLEEHDRGLQRILKETASFKDGYVCVGFFEGKELEDGGITLAGIAAVHEYGATIDNGWGKGIRIVIPERSFIRGWAADKREEIGRVCGNLYNRVVSGEISADKALHELGQYGVAGIKKKIDEGPFVPLAPSTLRLRRHGGSKPLIDTGYMRNSVRSEVRHGALPTEGVA
jgi:hypothetical protein